MGNFGYREIMGTDALSLKQLNDALRTIWKLVLGGAGARREPGTEGDDNTAAEGECES